jgi:hypothetical protein
MKMSVSESSAPTEWTTSSFSAASQPQTQETARIILTALSKNKKPQLVDAATEIASGEISPRSSVTRGHQALYLSPATLGLGYSLFQRPSPETISSMFRSELPPRPNKQSFLQRLHALSARPAQPDKGASNDHTFQTPDTEMGVPGKNSRSHNVDRDRYLKFWGLVLLGAVLSMVIGAFIYDLVSHVKTRNMNREIDEADARLTQKG